MKDIVIIGAGGFGREIYFHIQQINKEVPTWNVLGFIDDNATEMMEGYKLLGDLDYYLTMEPKPHFFIAISNSQARRRIAQRCLAAGYPAGSVIYPDLKIDDTAQVGEGCYIGSHCGIMSNAKIGSFNIIQAHSSFGHDTTLGDYNSIMTGMICGGETHIGDHCYFGLRCTVINQVNITDNCTFGACACVVKDCAEPGTYVGVPAKLIKPLQK